MWAEWRPMDDAAHCAGDDEWFLQYLQLSRRCLLPWAAYQGLLIIPRYTNNRLHEEDPNANDARDHRPVA